MNDIAVRITRDGKVYTGHIAKIVSTFLGVEDHGIFTASLITEFPGGGVGVGNSALDSYNEATREREGTAFGLDQIKKIMSTVGVSAWENLKGQRVIVLFDGDHQTTLGMLSVGIANVDSGEALIFKEHFEEWRQKNPSMV